jgi:hypothetical protein
MTAAAENSFAFSSAVTLDPGWYWIAILTNGTETVNAMPSATSAWSCGVTDLNTTGPRLTVSQSYGSLPTTFGTPTFTESGTTGYFGLKAQ